MTARLSGPLNCLDCGELCDGADDPTAPGGERPKPGDVSICIHCAGVAIFDKHPDGLTLRKPTAVELIELHGEPQFLAMMRATKAAIARLN